MQGHGQRGSMSSLRGASSIVEVRSRTTTVSGVGATDLGTRRLKGARSAKGAKLDQNIIDSTSPTTPTTMRMAPTTWMSMPVTVRFTAQARIAPSAMRKRLSPIPKTNLRFQPISSAAMLPSQLRSKNTRSTTMIPPPTYTLRLPFAEPNLRA